MRDVPIIWMGLACWFSIFHEIGDRMSYIFSWQCMNKRRISALHSSSLLLSPNRRDALRSKVSARAARLHACKHNNYVGENAKCKVRKLMVSRGGSDRAPCNTTDLQEQEAECEEYSERCYTIRRWFEAATAARQFETRQVSCASCWQLHWLTVSSLCLSLCSDLISHIYTLFIIILFYLCMALVFFFFH